MRRLQGRQGRGRARAAGRAGAIALDSAVAVAVAGGHALCFWKRSHGRGPRLFLITGGLVVANGLCLVRTIGGKNGMEWATTSRESKEQKWREEEKENAAETSLPCCMARTGEAKGGPPS